MNKLSPSEEEIMQIIWQTGEGNIKSFISYMKSPAPYTTIASIVKNLEKKGYLSSRTVGNTYLYKPLINAREFKKKFVNTVVSDYFDNSYKELVNFFVEQKKISADELNDIIALIENKKNK